MLENITFSYFAEQVVSHPALLIAVLLTLGVILVNGWTDAPNAIATCVSTRCIDVDKAIIMAAASRRQWKSTEFSRTVIIIETIQMSAVSTGCRHFYLPRWI